MKKKFCVTKSTRARRKTSSGNIQILITVILASIFGLLLFIGLIAFGRMQAKKSSTRAKQASAVTKLNLDIEQEQEAQATQWFRKNEVKLVEQAKDILKRINTGQANYKQIALNPRQAQRLTLARKSPEWSDFDLKTFGRYTWEIQECDGLGYFVLNGTRENYTTYRAYYLQRGSGLALDWDATTGFSPHPIENLSSISKQIPSLVRCWVAKDPTYDAKTNEELDSWYLLLDGNKKHSAWGVCAKDSPVDTAIKDIMRYGYFALSREREVRAIIQAKRESHLRKNEFRITDLITKEWVLPQGVTYSQ